MSTETCAPIQFEAAVPQFTVLDVVRTAEVRTGRTDGAYDVYLRVTGIDALAAELRSRGADIIDGPEDRVYGQRELVVRDCNGLIVAFGENTMQRAT